jgi:predicted HAD superfamily Cof-like phosphohydrolase
MNKQLEQVKEFRKAFHLIISDKPTFVGEIHYKLLKEEIEELKEADTITDQVDAIIDILYVTYGAILHMGIQDKLDRLFQEVHDSNMSKLEGGLPVFNEYGKVMKGKDYFPPYFDDILF